MSRKKNKFYWIKKIKDVSGIPTIQVDDNVVEKILVKTNTSMHIIQVGDFSLYGKNCRV